MSNAMDEQLWNLVIAVRAGMQQEATEEQMITILTWMDQRCLEIQLIDGVLAGQLILSIDDIGIRFNANAVTPPELLRILDSYAEFMQGVSREK